MVKDSSFSGVQMDRITSYTAASGELPIKVLLSGDLMKAVVADHIVIPVHVQLNPTNRCNLKCSWCSCSNVNRSLSLSAKEIVAAMYSYESLGCKAVTITGGGEPLLHDDIDNIIKAIYNMGISIGLVTNGWNVYRLSKSAWNKVDWVRISLGDDRTKEFESDEYWYELEKTAQITRGLSFSYVLTDKPDYDLLLKVVNKANEFRATHVRLTTDIVKRHVGTLQKIQQFLHNNADDSLVIYQNREVWTRGQKDCWISLLKPVVGADGGIYPCCGAQYADKTPSRDLSHHMRMGWLMDIINITNEQLLFDGSRCEVCYYSSYNRLLSKLLAGAKHAEFV